MNEKRTRACRAYLYDLIKVCDLRPEYELGLMAAVDRSLRQGLRPAEIEENVIAVIRFLQWIDGRQSTP